MVSNETLTVNATDVTGQRRVSLQTRRDQTIDELTEQIRTSMRLHAEDSDGRQVAYDLRHEGRAIGLAPSQIVGEALRDEDTVRVQPKISAGSRKQT
jgi:hypothetical protein